MTDSEKNNEVAVQLYESNNEAIHDIRADLLSQVGVKPLNEKMEITFSDLEFIVDIPAKAPKHEKLHKKIFSKHVQEKKILKSVNGVFRAGRTTAVMGASGAGKTSLLQVLAGEGHAGRVRGHIRVNGQEIFGQQMKKVSGFVFQDDLISTFQTVREAIEMSATLRLPKSVTKEERKTRVDGLIKLLNLSKCQNTIVGNSVIKGVSGGERKRCAIAMELVTNPPIIFLDEPTSGLDTFTAYSCISTMKRLAQAGRCVVATIHQPSSEIFNLFDDLLLLADGRVIYQGPISELRAYFEGLGYPTPAYTNYCDFVFLAILTNESRKVDNPYSNLHPQNESNRERLDRLLNHWEQSEGNSMVLKRIENRSESGISSGSIKQWASWLLQFKYLLWRTSKNAKRNPTVARAKIAQAIFTGFLIGLLYLNNREKEPPVQIQNTLGIIFFLAIQNVMMPCFSVLSIFAQEKEVFSREFGAGYYRLSSYFLAKVCVELPIFLVVPIINTLIIYFLSDMQRTAGKFFICVATTMLASATGFSLGIFFACIFPNLEIALSAAPLIMVPLLMLSGFFVNQKTIPVYMNWIKWLSPMKYSFEAISKNEFSGRTYPAVNSSVPSPTTGEQEITILGLDDGLSIGDCEGILIGMGIGLMFIAYLSMYDMTRKFTRGLYFENDPRHHRLNTLKTCHPKQAPTSEYVEAKREAEFLEKVEEKTPEVVEVEK